MNSTDGQKTHHSAQSAPAITLTKDLNALAAQCTAHKVPMRFRAQVVRVERKETKTGKPYFEVEFADAVGALKLKAWSDAPSFGFAEVTAEALTKPDVFRESGPVGYWEKLTICVEVSGHFSKGDFGVESGDWTVRALAEDERAEFFIGSKEVRAKQARDWGDIWDAVIGIKDPHFKNLCSGFLNRYQDDFQRAAAARGNHHARPGGLVEHVAGMMRAANVLTAAYNLTFSPVILRDDFLKNDPAPYAVNRDLLLAGVLFHDCGKLWENQYRVDSFEMPFSAAGEMIGHIPLGDELVRNLWAECEARDIAAGGDAWPGDKLLHLRHLILSHHGTKEWGSPVEPKTYEAMLLHMVDNIDAKMEMLRAAREKVAEIAPGVIGKSWPLGTSVVTPQWEDFI